MSARNRQRRCAYCGKLKKGTVDHIPPKLLLERPFPPNLWTVPSCRECNDGFVADDEYTRTLVGLDLRAASHRAVISNLPAILRSLERPSARSFVQYLAARTSSTPLLAWNGSPIVSMEIEQERVNNTGRHILRGLFYREFKRHVQEDAALRIGSAVGLRSDHPDAQTIARVFNKFPEHRHDELGSSFSYATAFGANVSVWLMILYDHFFWVATVDERPINEREPVDPATQ